MKVRRDKVTIKELIKDNKKQLNLNMLGGEKGLDREIKTNYLSAPGMLLVGFKKHFKHKAIQILGPQEVAFLKTLNKKALEKSIERLLSYNIPCIIVTGGLKVPQFLIRYCDKKKVPIISTKIKRYELVHQVLDYIEIRTAPYIYVHGTLVDVYGVGILFTGESGIGKSETALDLVARGHRFVADDVIKITRRASGIIMGEGKEPVDFFHSHIEIRGIGVVDFSRVFGVRATRLHKRVEVEVKLVKWGKEKDIDRTGLEGKTRSILGVKIPYKKIPLVPGKNVSVISEIVALEHLLKLSAYDTPRIFNKKLLDAMKRKGEKFARLDRDNE
jgi:HPr kinase/phosphorylase